MTNPLLSICIPTFNRADFLRWTLNKTTQDFPQAKVVVSDNGSTDATRTVVQEAGARYIRQSKNIGAFANMRAALLAGSTKYSVFLADDDYLVPEEVQKGILASRWWEKERAEAVSLIRQLETELELL